MNPQNVPKTADCAAAHEVAVVVVDFFQIIQIEEEHGERTAAAVRALGLIFQDIEQMPVVRQAGERIADGEVANLFEEVSVVQKCAAESDGVTHHHERLGKKEGSVQQALGLRGGKLSGDVEPSGGVNGAIESGIFVGQSAPIPNQTDEENCGGEKLLRAGEKGAGMRGNLRRQTAQCCGERIRQGDDGQQGSRDFPPRMAGTRDEMFNQQGDDEQECQDHAADPPGNRRPK